MKKLAQIVCFLIIFGSLAAVAHAQDTDALIRIDDPTCTPGPGCVVLEYTGPTETIPVFTLDPLTFLVSNPPGSYPDPAPPNNYNCGSDFFAVSLAIALPPFDPDEFFGCLFTGGTITNGDLYSISISGADIPINLSLGNDFECAPSDPLSCSGDMFTVDPTPEPSTALLYMSGLLLIFLVGFAKKRMGASFRT